MFKSFSKQVSFNISTMSKLHLFTVDVDGKTLYEEYLKSFPEGSNPIYKTNTEHDCSCCKNFIKNMGAVVAIKDNDLISIWDNGESLPYPYNIVSTHLSKFIKNKFINSIYLSNIEKYGLESNKHLVDGNVITHNHFYCQLNKNVVSNRVDTLKSIANTSIGVFTRGLEELTLNALDDTLMLIDDKDQPLYRGLEHRKYVVEFKKLKSEYDKLKTEKEKNLFIWSKVNNPLITFKNSVIGTLVYDLSTGFSILEAAKRFENKMGNYKRTTAPISSKMVELAFKDIDDNDFRDSLNRRFANINDVSPVNVLWVNSKDQLLMNKDSLKESLIKQVKNKTLKINDFINKDTISMFDFVNSVLPNTSKLEVFFEKPSNLVTLMTEKIKGSKHIFKWDNPFSWSYSGNNTDSFIKEKVKKAGGNINAKLRISLSWFNKDDLDLHLFTPTYEQIYFGNKKGILDIDMNAHGEYVRDPVENMALNTIENGSYKVVVDNFCKRERIDNGLILEVEYENIIHRYKLDRNILSNESLLNLTFNNGKLLITKLNKDLEETTHSSNLHWGIKTGEFHEVSTVMKSPNYWDNNVGNLHWFFMIKDCVSDESMRGLYNEYLIPFFDKHRKVLDTLAETSKCEIINNQLSGLGFSETLSQKPIIVKVNGNKIFNVSMK